MRLTKPQTVKLADWVKERLPRSTAGQTDFLAENLEQFDEKDIERIMEVIRAHAYAGGDEGRMNVGHIVDRIRAATSNGAAALASAVKLANDRRAAEQAEQERADRSCAEALAFCRSLDPTTLEQMRAEVLAALPFTAKAHQRKPRPTLESTALVSLIYQRFAAGRETRTQPPTPEVPQHERLRATLAV